MKTQPLLVALVVASLNLTIANAQEKDADPYVTPKKDGTPATAAAKADDQPISKTRDISICYEAFSVPLAVAAALQRSQLEDPALYAKLISSVEKKEAKHEILMVVRTRTDQKSSGESIQEMIYPTEFEAAKIAVSSTPAETESKEDNKATPVVTGKTSGLIAPATPGAFQTRNVGFTLEVASTQGANANLWDLRLVSDYVSFAGLSKSGQGVSEAEMPLFECQRINTAVTVNMDRPYLLGTMNPPPVSKVDSNSAKTVWFAFITATFPK